MTMLRDRLRSGDICLTRPPPSRRAHGKATARPRAPPLLQTSLRFVCMAHRHSSRSPRPPPWIAEGTDLVRQRWRSLPSRTSIDISPFRWMASSRNGDRHRTVTTEDISWFVWLRHESASERSSSSSSWNTDSRGRLGSWPRAAEHRADRTRGGGFVETQGNVSIDMQNSESAIANHHASAT
jgi:hypothetical protein